MATVKSVTIYGERPWANGKVKRRYEVTITDNDGTDHSRILMPIKVDPSDDGSSAGALFLAQKEQQERDRYLSRVENGEAVDFQAGKLNTTKVLFQYVMRAAFKAGRESELRFNMLPHLELVNDTQLGNLLDKTPEQVTNLRSKAAQLQAIKDAEDLYTPEEI